MIVKKRINNRIYLTEVKSPNKTEYYINIISYHDYKDIENVMLYLDENEINVVYSIVFGDIKCSERLQFTEKDKFPVLWIEPLHLQKNKINGISLYCVSGVPIEKVYDDQQVIGTIVNDGEDKHIYLTNNGCKIKNEDCILEQVTTNFQYIESYFNNLNIQLNDTVRTWFYNHKILDWYGVFNTVRTEFYVKNKIFDRILPASTGIEGNNKNENIIKTLFYAINRKKNSKLEIRTLDSPLQDSATDYGSSFSRAIEVVDEHHRHISVSGTASIDKDGNTCNLDDINAQIEYTISVVEAILNKVNVKKTDVVRAFVYLKKEEYLNNFKSFLKEKVLEDWPLIICVTNICRDNLLFELELEAIIEK